MCGEVTLLEKLNTLNLRIWSLENLYLTTEPQEGNQRTPLFLMSNDKQDDALRYFDAR